MANRLLDAEVRQHLIPFLAQLHLLIIRHAREPGKKKGRKLPAVTRREASFASREAFKQVPHT